MQLLISDGQIAGVFPEGESVENLPIGFTIADFDEIDSIESLYFADGKVHKIPDRPSENHVWIGDQWSEIGASVFHMQRGADWDGLLSDLRGSEIWAKSFESASTSIASNSAWTLLYGTITSTKHLDDLTFAIGALRSAMKSTDGGDFTKAQIKALNKIMNDRGFPKIE